MKNIILKLLIILFITSGYITNGGVVLNSKGENETNLKVDNINVFYIKKEEEFNEEVK